MARTPLSCGYTMKHYKATLINSLNYYQHAFNTFPRWASDCENMGKLSSLGRPDDVRKR